MTKSVLIFLMLILLPPCGAIAETPLLPAGEPSGAKWIHDIRLGVLDHDVDNLWSGHRKEEGVDFNMEVVFQRLGLAVLSGVVRPNVGFSLNNQGDTSKVYGGLLWEVTGGLFFFDLGLGAAWHNGERDTSDPDKKSLGSRVLFRIPIEVGVILSGPHRVSIMFDHVSNAYLASPNEGLDTLGVRYSYVFD